MNKQEIEKAIAYWKEFKSEIPELKASYPDAGLDEQEETVDLAISALEHQLTNGWIPVSEQLPEETDRYLVTYREWTDGNYLPKYDDVYVRIWRYRKDEQYTGFVYPPCCNIEAEKDTHREVLAWKIIEPYKEAL